MKTIICYVKDFKNNTCFKIEMEYVDNFGRNYELTNGSTIYVFSQLPLFNERPKEPVYFENLTT